MELFGERPYAAVSTTELARRAGVARGLINHYFGTKRDLYLEVVRRMVTIPQVAVDRLPDGPLEERVAQSVTWFLDGVSPAQPHLAGGDRRGGRGPGGGASSSRRPTSSPRTASWRRRAWRPREELRALVRAYGGLVKATAREWLVRETLTRAQVQRLLSTALLSIVRDVAPKLQEP